LVRGLHSGRDRDPVPGIHGRDRPEQLGELLVAELGCCFVPDGARNVLVADQRDRVGERECSPFAVAEEGRVAPGGEAVQALLAFAGLTRLLGVRVDAVETAVEDRGAQVDKFPQSRVELDGLAKCYERSVRRRSGLCDADPSWVRWRLSYGFATNSVLSVL
jgi:hypothetical protein